MKSSKENDQNNTSLEYLFRALQETQATIRAYDTKAEVLSIILTLIAGVVNFALMNKMIEAHYWIKFVSLITITLVVSTIICAGMVLYPRQNLFNGLTTGSEKPRGTYFFTLEKSPSFKDLDEYISEVDATEWKREIAYEVLKTSCIRDHKHFWFHFAINFAAATLFTILVLISGVAYYG